MAKRIASVSYTSSPSLSKFYGYKNVEDVSVVYVRTGQGMTDDQQRNLNKKREGLKDNMKELQQNPNEKGQGEDWKEKPKYEN